MKALISVLQMQSTKRFINKFIIVYKSRIRLLFWIIPVLFLSVSCKGTLKSAKIARAKIKEYKIPETLYKDEWGMKSYKLFSPRFNSYRHKFNDGNKNEYKLIFRRWCKGENEAGKTIKLRMDIFFDIKRFENGTYELSEVGFENIVPLTMTRQVLTWLGLVFFGLLFLTSWTSVYKDSGNAVLGFFHIIWLAYTCYVSYLSFMSGWGIIPGVFLVGLLYYIGFSVIKK
jgi:hypothetical protein